MSHPESGAQGETLGPYQLGLLLGKGGMGEVYRAFDSRLERWVAVKRLRGDAPAQARERFRREARTLAQLGHPAIVQIFDIVEDEAGDWIVMELVQGPTLAALRRKGPLDVGLALEYGRQIASALEAAHASGIVHRDLKTENVMVPPSGQAVADRVKVLDFGLARSVMAQATEAPLLIESPTHGEAGLTLPGNILGTPRAMSPEQATGRPVDARSDLFSFGVLLYEILTARSPFTASSVEETLQRVVYHHPPPARQLNPQVPPALSNLVLRLLDKEPTHRPATAAAVAAELGALAAGAAAQRGPAAGAETLDPRDRASVHAGQELDGPLSTTAGITPVFLPRPAGQPASSTQSRRRNLGERRQVTVLCCDLVRPEPTAGGVTAPDPETLSEVLPELLERAAELIARYEGTLVDTFGHRLVAYFGYPVAHEDDAVRAVRAGLELIESQQQQTGPGQPRQAALRIGLHTGSAVVAAGETRRDPVILGSTFDETVAVQVLAAPDEVVLSAATRRLTGSAFDLEPVAGAGAAEGWRVLATNEPQSEAGSMIEILPMVSRERELELLLSRWQMAEEGHGQVVLISGEAGIGKSRLVRAFRDALAAPSRRWWVVYGSPFLQSSPLAPIATLLRREVLRHHRGEAVEVELERLEAFLARYHLPRDEVAHLFTDFLELPAAGRYAGPDLSPDARRQRTLEALVALFLEMAEEQPWVLAIEDLHWVDPSTLELLGLLIERTASAPLYVLATSRPHGAPTWERGVALTQIHLGQLSEREGAELIARVAAGRTLDPTIGEQILARTDGVPLFIEELTKTVLEADQDSDSFTIPATLRDSLTARLDRLGSAKEVAQTAAVIGRGFTLELLAAVADTGDPLLQHELDRLMDAALIYRKGFGANTRYFFKHALIQDIACDSLLRKDRQALHRRIAEVLVERFPETRDTQPEIVAHHLAEAGDAAEAIPYWRRAGQQALAESAYLEALQHLERALALLEALPNRTQYAAEELAVLAGLGTAWTITRGFTAPEVERAWGRAHALCKQIENAPSFDILWGLFGFHAVRGAFRKTPAIIEQMLRVARERDDPSLHLQSLYLSGVCSFFAGRPRDALNDLEQASAHSRPEIGPALIQAFGQDHRTSILSYEALALWLRGAPDQALACSRRALEMAHQTSHPFTICCALLLTAILYLFRREGDEAEKQAAAVIELSQQHGIYMDRDGAVLAACARVARALGADGRVVANGDEALVPALSSSLEPLLASGAQTWSSLYTAHLAMACLADGDLAQTSQLLDQALDKADTDGELFWKAELHRLCGDLALGQGKADRAREAYRQALAVAEEQGARSLELRAMTSLIELDGGAEAGSQLAAIFGRFSEGFDTPDLRRAKRLLAALSTP